MSFESTTTLAALDNFSTTIGVLSTAHMRVPGMSSGRSRRTYLRIDDEQMSVEQVLGAQVAIVQRGVLGSRAVAHPAGAVVEVVGENYGVDYG